MQEQQQSPQQHQQPQQGVQDLQQRQAALEEKLQGLLQREVSMAALSRQGSLSAPQAQPEHSEHAEEVRQLQQGGVLVPHRLCVCAKQK
jgi:hypothetical protein